MHCAAHRNSGARGTLCVDGGALSDKDGEKGESGEQAARAHSAKCASSSRNLKKLREPHTLYAATGAAPELDDAFDRSFMYSFGSLRSAFVRRPFERRLGFPLSSVAPDAPIPPLPRRLGWRRRHVVLSGWGDYFDSSAIPVVSCRTVHRSKRPVNAPATPHKIDRPVRHQTRDGNAGGSVAVF